MSSIKKNDLFENQEESKPQWKDRENILRIIVTIMLLSLITLLVGIVCIIVFAPSVLLTILSITSMLTTIITGFISISEYNKLQLEKKRG
ncbi:MAG: hypothetical protein FWC91_03915 [Defluviitaleaceae bacterium]|nr:hypothetical protein [Defluviitaleaceae bacterium]